MKKILFLIAFSLIASISFGQFADTAAAAQFIRDTIKDRRPEKVTAAQLQKALLGINNLIGTASSSGTTNYVQKWTGSGFGNSSIYNNGTKIGIGTTSADSTLHIVGGFKYQNGSQGVGKVLESDANGGARWQTRSIYFKSSQFETYGPGDSIKIKDILFSGSSSPTDSIKLGDPSGNFRINVRDNINIEADGVTKGLIITSTVSGNTGYFKINPRATPVGSPVDFDLGYLSPNTGRLFINPYELVHTGTGGINTSGRLTSDGITSTGTAAITALTVTGGFNNYSNSNADNIWYMGTAGSGYKKAAIIQRGTGSWGLMDLEFAMNAAADVSQVAVNGTATKVIFKNDGKVGIGTTSPASSALLHVASTTSGVLLAPMTSTQMNAISSPVEGTLVYDLTNHLYKFWNGTAWTAL